MGALDGLRVLSFEARRADELATMLARHGGSVRRAPALRETGLPESPEAHELARRLAASDIQTVILLTGVGTRALAAAVSDSCPDFARHLERATVIARGPKPLAALRELGIGGAHPVPAPHTWHEVLGVVDTLGAAAGR
ncbi:MAG: uroporphyrinogen-III synthase, partial [Deltaproteobacteria bacterium]